jgi:hypothetical protein
MGLLVTHLTIIDRNLEDMRSTYAGMAHFAGSGPDGFTCRSCIFWKTRGTSSFDYYAKGGKQGGKIKPERCAKYRIITGGDIGPAIPDTARACKYFELSQSVPERYSR